MRGVRRIDVGSRLRASRRPLPTLVLTLLAILVALGAPAASQAALSDLAKVEKGCLPGNTSYRQGSTVCVIAFNDLKTFTSTPGDLVGMSLRTESATASDGEVVNPGFVHPWYLLTDWHADKGFWSTPDVTGTWKIKTAASGGALKDKTVTLDINGDPTDGVHVTCPTAIYIACHTSQSTAGKVYWPRDLAVVRLTTRPLIVRIVNQTGHTLARSAAEIASNMLHDTQIPDPATIPSYDAAAPGANIGWYNYYRPAVRAKRAISFDTTYTLQPAAESNLAGSTIRIIVALKSDGSDDNSRCVTDEQHTTYLDCSVALTGSASGTLVANVYVAQ